MNAKQQRTVGTLEYRVKRLSEDYQCLYEKGFKLEVTEEMLEGCEKPYVQFSVRNIEPKWYERSMYVVGSIGERGGLNLVGIQATDDEKWLMQQLKGKY